MINNYFKKKAALLKTLSCGAAFLLFPGLAGAQQSYTFTPCGATGTVGPTQTMVNNTYSSTNLNGQVTTTTNGIQTWTVPYTGNFRITARGASGGVGLTAPGKGAIMIGDIALNGGEVLHILVGQKGEDGNSSQPAGGGGGSFVVRTPYTTTASCLIAAGGGSGGGNYAATDAVTVTAGVSSGGAGGVNGNGGTGGTRGAGGGGFLTDGGFASGSSAYSNPGQAFVNGGEGGPSPNHSCGFLAAGGFGGGASHGGNCIANGGAGGGFSGGGGSSNNATAGGGSINQGSNQVNSVATTTGDGMVVIQELCSVRIFASGSNSLNPSICAGNSLTLTTNAVSNYSWSTGATTSSIVVSPNSNTTYSLVATTSVACTSVGMINVLVSTGLPVLSISNPSNNICLGKTVSLNATGAVTYTWANPGIANGQTFTPTSTTIYTVTGQNGCGTSSAVTTITVAPLAIAVTASPAIVCEGMPSVLTATAAATNYTWLPTGQSGTTIVVAPTVSSIYTIAASDGTCSGTNTISVQTKTTPTITAVASTGTICAGQSATITVSGAGANGTYSWTHNGSTASSLVVNPTIPTMYTIFGTNSVNCTSGTQQLILIDAAPQLSVTANKTYVCEGAPVILTASGANGYNWANGPTDASITVNPVSATVYTVSGTHTINPCVTTKTIMVQTLNPNVTVTPSISICNGGQATLIATGASNYTWTGFQQGPQVITPTLSTTYTLNATTQSLSLKCITTHTTLVTVNANPVLTVTFENNIICRGETHKITVSGANNYTWSTGGTGTMVSVSPTIATTYTVLGVNSAGCESVLFFQAKVNACTGIDGSVADTRKITLFPNPSNGHFVIKSDYDVSLKLINSIGQSIRTFKLSADNNYEAQVSDLAAGVYYIVDETNISKLNERIIISK